MQLYCLVFFVAVEFVPITVFEVNVETPFSTPRRFTTIKEITTGLEKEGQQTPESRRRSVDLRLELPVVLVKLTTAIHIKTPLDRGCVSCLSQARRFAPCPLQGFNPHNVLLLAKYFKRDYPSALHIGLPPFHRIGVVIVPTIFFAKSRRHSGFSTYAWR